MEEGGELISCIRPQWVKCMGDLRVFLNDFLYFTHPVPLVKFDIFSARCRNVEEGRYTQYYV